jgi:hypothetical protein
MVRDPENNLCNDVACYKQNYFQDRFICDIVSSFPPYSFRRFMYLFLRLYVYFLNSKTNSK